jgi:PTH1 family peptidyl-tRNA hydrolase
MSWIIAGLGNPGEEYSDTRHNTGRLALYAFAKKNNFSEFKNHAKSKSLLSEGIFQKEKISLVAPDNFMNRSGFSVAPFVTSIKKAEKLIVIYDDLDVPLGSFKISFNRSAGGHRGVQSIITALKTEAFIRIRIGISPATPSGKLKKPKGEAAVEKHIIGPFKKAELDILKKVNKKVTEAIEVIITEGYNKAMSVYNSASIIK